MGGRTSGDGDAAGRGEVGRWRAAEGRRDVYASGTIGMGQSCKKRVGAGVEGRERQAGGGLSPRRERGHGLSQGDGEGAGRRATMYAEKIDCIGSWACGWCGEVYDTQAEAERCCNPRLIRERIILDDFEDAGRLYENHS